MTRVEKWTIGLMLVFLSLGFLALALLFAGEGIVIQDISAQLQQERQDVQAQLPKGANCDTEVVCLNEKTGAVTCGPCPIAGTAL